MATVKTTRRIARHQRIRDKVRGTSERPRLAVFRSLKNIHAQLVDDTQEKTLLALSTTAKEIKEKIKYAGNTKAAALLGGVFAAKALAQGIKSIIFDRGGYAYHGRVKALAEALRKGGLVF